MDVSSVGGAAASAARPAPEPKAPPKAEPAEEKKAESPAVAKSEDQATPPPKKSLGSTLDISV